MDIIHWLQKNVVLKMGNCLVAAETNHNCHAVTAAMYIRKIIRKAKTGKSIKAVHTV